jgi:tetratricopeptide (TPR) repeat protein
VTPRTALRAAVVAVLGLGVGACATPAPIAPPPPISSVPPRVEAPPPPTPSLPSERERLAAPHNEASDGFEKAGDLRRALDESKIALTINPGDAKAQEARKRLEGLIARGVTQRIDEGRAALARGAYVEARRRFLAALALDPTNTTAQEALRNEARAMDTVNHTVRGGDTLASLAQQYYGDSARAEVIADSNGLALNARLTPGRTIKVPEIPGVPFRPPGRTEGVAALPPLTPPPAAAPTPATPGAAEAAIPPPPPPAPPPPPERNVLLAGAENALQKRQYTAALSDIDRFLAQNPGNAEGQAVRKQALYGVAKSQFDGKNYDGAYRSLTELAKVAPGYEDSSALMQESRRRMIDQHYSQGIRFYREEKLKEAIAEWRVVLELDPQHVNAKKNIEQSEKLLKGLEERRKK